MAGLDPYEERLLIALLGGGVALIFAIALGIICCRKYRLDRSAPGGGAGGGGKDRQWAVMQQHQQLMYNRQHGQQPAYFPTGHKTNVNMDPAYLDPARGINLVAGPPPPQANLNPTYASAVHQQRPVTQQNIDNTAYASVPVPFGRPAAGMSYSSHQV